MPQRKKERRPQQPGLKPPTAPRLSHTPTDRLSTRGPCAVEGRKEGPSRYNDTRDMLLLFRKAPLNVGQLKGSLFGVAGTVAERP